jgi:hypothetical protein
MTRRNVARLLLVGLLLALLALPIVGAAVDVQAVDGHGVHFTLLQEKGTDAGPAAVIACSSGSGSQSGCGGG